MTLQANMAPIAQFFSLFKLAAKSMCLQVQIPLCKDMRRVLFGLLCLYFGEDRDF